MPDELNYESHLLTFDQARQIFGHDNFFGMLVEYAIQNFVRTEQILAEWERRRAQDAEEQQTQASAVQQEAVPQGAQASEHQSAQAGEPQGAQVGEPQGSQATSSTADQMQGGAASSA